MRVREMFAFVVADRGPSDEGIPAIQLGNMAYPMVGADMERAESLYREADAIAQQAARRVELRVWNSHQHPGHVVKSWGSNPAPCTAEQDDCVCDLWGNHAGDHEWHGGLIDPQEPSLKTWA